MAVFSAGIYSSEMYLCRSLSNNVCCTSLWFSDTETQNNLVLALKRWTSLDSAGFSMFFLT